MFVVRKDALCYIYIMANEQLKVDSEETQEYKPADSEREPEKSLESQWNIERLLKDTQTKIDVSLQEGDADLRDVVADYGSMILHDLAFKSDLTIEGKDQNGVKVIVPSSGIDDLKLRPK